MKLNHVYLTKSVSYSLQFVKFDKTNLEKPRLVFIPSSSFGFVVVFFN